MAKASTRSPEPNWNKVVTAFDRRQRAALLKLHLPTVEDLIFGMTFFGGELESDVLEFAQRSAPVADTLGLHPLAVALTELSMSPSREGVENLTLATDGWSITSRAEKFIQVVLLRRRIYLAAWGGSGALSDLAMETITAALNQLRHPSNNDAYLPLIFRSMELLATAAAFKPFEPYLGGSRIWQFNNADKNLLSDRGISETITQLIIRKDDQDSTQNPLASAGNRLEGLLKSTGSTDGPTSVVIPWVGNSSTSEGKIASSYAKGILGTPLPLTTSPDLPTVHSTLMSEFPHAVSQIWGLLATLGEGRQIKLQPTIVVGAPGSGKSHFCRRLLECLGVKYTMVPFAGMSDSAVIGTARRYSTGEPSLPVSTIIAHQTANPGIILDEIEKAGTGSHNGNAIEALLPMLEAVTASSYHDPYLQAPADISNVIWLMTANSIGPLAKPFRDRCRVIEFPTPSKEHLQIFVSNILPALTKERGQSPDMFRLDGSYMASLDHWTDGSLRTLKKMVAAILADHDSRGWNSPN